MKTEKRHPNHFCATWTLIKEDYDRHGCDSSRAGFRALAVHRFGEWAFARRGKVTGFISRRLFWFLHRRIRNHYGIEIMRGARLGRRVIFVHQGGIVIHNSSKIGDNCLIRHGVTLGARSRKQSKKAPTLENNVEVGVGAVIIGDITIGENAIIVPNTVVMTNVPANAVVVPPTPEIIIKQKEIQQEGSRSSNGIQAA